jgi:large subunit ribosomal protein L17
MRHGKKINHLGRTSAHRKAMLSNMASSLILHKRVSTTVAKAKALRKYVEPLLTKSKSDTTHSRRIIFSYLQNKESLKELFDQVSGKIANRPGGYTRILKTGNRLGDNADMCIIELVDYNEAMLGAAAAASAAKPRTRRRSSGKKKEDGDNTATPAATATSEAPAAPAGNNYSDTSGSETPNA